jgi:hypothetical protein
MGKPGERRGVSPPWKDVHGELAHAARPQYRHAWSELKEEGNGFPTSRGQHSFDDSAQYAL